MTTTKNLTPAERDQCWMVNCTTPVAMIDPNLETCYCEAHSARVPQVQDTDLVHLAESTAAGDRPACGGQGRLDPDDRRVTCPTCLEGQD